MSAQSKVQRKRGAKAALLAAVAALHSLLFLQIARSLQPPSSLGAGTSERVAMQVALAPAAILEDPRSQGADEQTQTQEVQETQTPPIDRATQAQGAGSQPTIMAGGSHADTHAKEAPTAAAGGGGGSQDDPFARASLPAQLDTAAAFDLGARNDALFLSRVAPCLKVEPATLAGVQVAVTLGDNGVVASALPLRPGRSVKGVRPTPGEAQAIAAVRACAPYHDLVLGQTPVLKLPAVPPAQKAALATAAQG